MDEQVFLKKFGANLRRERVKASLTQEQLSELADLNIRSLQRIEAGENNVLVTTTVKLLKALKISWEKLMPFH